MGKQNWIKSTAAFSPCFTWRYSLHRQLSENNDTTCLFIMLNPSTADEYKNDPTVERCERYTLKWGYGNLKVCNLFALRSTDPNQLYTHSDPVGPENNLHILHEAKRASLIICAWGNHGQFKNRSYDVRQLLNDYSVNYLVLNKSGEPSHPLYLRSDLLPQKW